MEKRKRGSTLCGQCGCSNGNKAITCKGCRKLLPRRAEKQPRLAVQICKDVSSLRKNLPGAPQSMKILSCRVRREGPDFRTFVTEDRGDWRCLYKDCSAAQDARQRSKATAATTVAVHCQHIRSAQLELTSQNEGSSELEPLALDILSELPFPPSIKNDLEKLKEGTSSLIERVSNESFAVRDKRCSQEHPLGLLHVRFRKCEPRPTFHCPCQTFQSFSAQISGAGTTAKPSRRCLHFYICLWAFACNSALAKEFSYFTARSCESLTSGTSLTIPKGTYTLGSYIL